MKSGRDWLLRPVVAGLCKYESLKDGALNLIDVAELNEALDVARSNSAEREA